LLVESGCLGRIVTIPEANNVIAINAIPIPTTTSTAQAFPYETAYRLLAGQGIKLDALGAGQCTSTVHIVEEEI